MMTQCGTKLVASLPILGVIGLYGAIVASPAGAAAKPKAIDPPTIQTSPPPASMPAANTTPPAGSSSSSSTTSSSLWTGSDAGRSASALFSLTGNTLTMTLNNTSQADSWVPTDILTGLFFNFSGATLSPLAAALGQGSQVYGATAPVNNVGGEWAAGSSKTIASNTYDYGVSAAGLGLFGPKDRFDPSSNLSGTENVGGLDYGIVTAGDNAATGNGGLDRSVIKGSVLFTFGLTNVASNFNLAQSISNLRFQYGTATNEPSFVGSLSAPPITPPVTPPVTPPITPPVTPPITPPVTPPITPPITPPVELPTPPEQPIVPTHSVPPTDNSTSVPPVSIPPVPVLSEPIATAPNPPSGFSSTSPSSSPIRKVPEPSMIAGLIMTGIAALRTRKQQR